jgi:hypothetical protein
MMSNVLAAQIQHQVLLMKGVVQKTIDACSHTSNTDTLACRTDVQQQP